MHFVREIRRWRVKCLWALEDLFHFTLTKSKFHNLRSKLFHILRKQNISLKTFASKPFCFSTSERTLLRSDFLLHKKSVTCAVVPPFPKKVTESRLARLQAHSLLLYCLPTFFGCACGTSATVRLFQKRRSI